MALRYRTWGLKQKGAAQNNVEYTTAVGNLATYLVLSSRIMPTIAS